MLTKLANSPCPLDFDTMQRQTGLHIPAASLELSLISYTTYVRRNVDDMGESYKFSK